jgi:hypothetical protein
MPAKTYMVVDERHDHSFRVPRPDLSAKLGTPNACNGCHTDKSPQWAASAVDHWHGPNRKGFQNYAEAFTAAWSDQPNAANLLAAVAADSTAPAFARAGALTELSSRASPSSISLARQSLSDSDPMVRIAALDMLEAGPWHRHGRWLPRYSPIQSRRSYPRCGTWRRSQRRHYRRRMVNVSSAPLRNSSPPSASTPIVPRHGQRLAASSDDADNRSLPRPNIRRPCV